MGPARGENRGDYNITNSFELGYRWSLVGGDVGEYRSDVNYGNGVRLLGSSLSIDSKDGHGHYFDQILLNTMGLGNDPYQFVSLRVQKNQLYRYDMVWRLQDYYNPGLTVAGGLHLMDTVRRIQDHDLTIFPQSKFRARVGYSRNVQDGPSLTTSLEPDNNSTLSTALPVFVNLRREWNEYRLGGDAEVAGFKFTVLRRWDFYKEDSPYALLPGSQRDRDRAARRPDGAGYVHEGGAGPRDQRGMAGEPAGTAQALGGRRAGELSVRPEQFRDERILERGGTAGRGGQPPDSGAGQCGTSGADGRSQYRGAAVQQADRYQQHVVQQSADQWTLQLYGSRQRH